MFIAMACYDGETLKRKIEGGPLKLEDAIDISIQLSEGLSKAHENEIVHRDLKPANVMLTKDGVVKILDFGLAKLRGQTKLTKTGITLGTAPYMSPEQTQGIEVDYRTDIWALGAAIYEMLTGQQPFIGDYEQAVMYSIMNEDPEPPTALRTGVPMELERIVDKCLEKHPSSRYQQVDELIVDLKRAKAKPESGKNLTVWVNDENSKIWAFDFYDSSFITMRGLKVGDAVKRLEQLYGERSWTVKEFSRVGPYDYHSNDYSEASIYEYWPNENAKWYIIFYVIKS